MEKTTQVHNITPELLVEKVVRGVQQSFQPSNSPKNALWKYITRKEASQKLGVSYMALDNWDKKGILKKRKIGSRVYYLIKEIENILEKSAS